MFNRNQNKPKSFLWGAIAGGVVGAVSALLLAPKSGSDLRKDLADRAQQAGDSTVRIANQARHQTEKLVQQVGAQTTQLADKTKHAIQDIRKWRSPRQTDDISVTSGIEELDAEGVTELLESADGVQVADVQEFQEERDSEDAVKL